MFMIEITQTPLLGVLLITPPQFGDSRGFFSETWSRCRFQDHGINIDFKQDNHSFSRNSGTIRGLHFQAPPHAQDKLVRCGRGRLFDVAVDIRRGSPSYGQWYGAELSFDNGKQLLVPKGFLHGFSTLEPDTEIIYKCSDYYAPDHEGAVQFSDPEIGIDWQFDTTTFIASAKDQTAPLLRDFKSPFHFEG